MSVRPSIDNGLALEDEAPAWTPEQMAHYDRLMAELAAATGRTEYVVRYVSPGFPDGHEFVGIDRRMAEDFRRAAILSGWSVAPAIEERQVAA